LLPLHPDEPAPPAEDPDEPAEAPYDIPEPPVLDAPVRIDDVDAGASARFGSGMFANGSGLFADE